MTGLTITSNSTTGRDLTISAYNPVTVAAGVTITNGNSAALYSKLASYWSIVNSGTLLAAGDSVASDGIALFDSGGAITNTTVGSVAGYAVGISVAGSGTVVNDGTIQTTGTGGSGFNYVGGSFTPTSAGVILGSGGVSNAAGGLISSYFEGVAIGGGGSVANAGTILGTSDTKQSFGVVLTAGGSVTNALNAVISSPDYGILAFGTEATVSNQGTISGQNNVGVELLDGGVLSNASTGIIGGFNSGVLALGYARLTVTNAAGGTITGYKYGVLAVGNAPLTVTNAADGIIAGHEYGVKAGRDTVATVTNAGYIGGYAVYGVFLSDGGTLSNTTGGIIAGGDIGVIAQGSIVATVTNAGYIAGYTSVGVVLLDGGTIDNQTPGRIHGLVDGILTSGSDNSTIVNAGIVYGVDYSGIFLRASGSLTNTGNISGPTFGVLVSSEPGTVLNAGSISAFAEFKSTDTAFASAGVLLDDGGVVTNSAGGAITSNWNGVQIFYGSGTVINAGTIATSVESLPPGSTFVSIGAELADGGTVSNATGGTIASYSFGVQIFNASGTVANAGSIADAEYRNGAGIQLDDGGLVTNNLGGRITSEWMGVQIYGSVTDDVDGTVINHGTILAVDRIGDGAGVWIHAPGAVTNAVGGLISGGADGVVAYYQTTLVNQGTIFGTDNAFIAAGTGVADRVADRIIDDPGGVFLGEVNGGNTIGSAIYSTLELASGSSVGTIGNIGTFTNFGRIALDAGASWSVGGAFATGETVAFGGTQAALILTSPSAASGAIMAGFTATDTIALSGITDVTKLTFNGDILTVSESSGPGLELQFAAPESLTFNVVGNATDITLVPCFLPGTHILTGHGEVPVEKLHVGDTIVTLSGHARRLCWIGHGRSLATRGQRGPATPVIVRKGALADNVPHRDLHITKGHSLYLDGVLIPVEFLVNHRNILWDDRAQEVTVYHLELDTHDVLVANGAAAESYRDDGNRWLFQNANAGWDQPPKPPCAPVLTGGAVVDAVWRRILDRAGARPGLPLTDDPDLHLLVDGVRVDAIEQQGPVHVFRLKRRPDSVCIASREVVPAELGLARDPRSLGVALRRVAVRQGTRFVVLKADDARLVDGFHAYEAAPDLRWTDGRADLPAEVFAGFSGGVEVVVHVAATTQYPHDGIGAASVAA
ncbi:Hint domain-containing protein [Acidisphaera sp. S103]|uniref:Hint domain-containing protein n=1 Tax=Acidisphaera sp. S103 TaxID=1747223 RepID=UPI00131DC5AE|nr:Hint domain-containing protein [Acidisphaera sp. S103]